MDSREPGADEIITAVTYAPTLAGAHQVIAGVRSLAVLREVADQLYIPADGHGAAWLRRAIVDEARS